MQEEHKENEFDREVKKQQKYWKKNMIWTVVILVAAAIYYAFAGTSMTFEYRDTGFYLTAPDKSALELPYADIRAIDYAESPDYGACVQGSAKGNYHYGTWQNDAWGTYTLFAHAKTKACVVVTTDSGVVALNSSSDTDTKALYDGMLEKWQGG